VGVPGWSWFHRKAPSSSQGELQPLALLEWLDELDERYGPPSPEGYAWAKEALTEAEGLRGSETSAA
jgi:hypothetical protein